MLRPQCVDGLAKVSLNESFQIKRNVLKDRSRAEHKH